MGKQSKEATLKRWSDKGLDWCVNQLWKETNARNNLADELSVRKYHDAKLNLEDYEWANRAYARVLRDNGIRPQKLIVRYEWSAPCPDYCGSDCWDCPRDIKETIETMHLYEWSVSEDEMTGIASDFKRLELDVLEIIDCATGRTLYSKPKEDDDGR